MAKTVKHRKDPAAVALGRKGGKARIAKLSKEERRRLARLAVQTRWARAKAAKGPPLPRDGDRMKRAAAPTHPDATDPSVFAHIADRLRKVYGATQVIVYGSVARGEATIHSDIDLLVVAPSTEKAYLRMAHVLALIRDLSRGLPVSPIVLTPEELQRRLARKDHFVQEILDEGIAL